MRVVSRKSLKSGSGFKTVQILNQLPLLLWVINSREKRAFVVEVFGEYARI